MLNDNKQIDENFADFFFKGIGVKEQYNPDIPIVIVGAHPDDETIGAFSILSNFSAVRVIHITDGAPKNMVDALREGFNNREDYAKQRRKELYDVLSRLNIPENNCIEIPVSDQEASYHLDVITIKLIEILDSIKPQFVFTHAYEGGHPDHDAAAFVVHAACSMLKSQKNTAPVIIEYAIYNTYKGSFEMNRLIPIINHKDFVISLDEAALKLKTDVLKYFTTQQYLIKNYSSTIESYRIAPAYDFTKPPYEGKINYDNFDWGIKSKEWCELASATLKMLDIESRI